MARIIRRVATAPAPAPVAAKRTTFTTAQKVDAGDIHNGVKKMRRVWIKGRNGPNDPHWYFESFTQQGAINAMARASKEPASNFEAEQ